MIDIDDLREQHKDCLESACMVYIDWRDVHHDPPCSTRRVLAALDEQKDERIESQKALIDQRNAAEADAAALRRELGNAHVIAHPSDRCTLCAAARAHDERVR